MHVTSVPKEEGRPSRPDAVRLFDPRTCAFFLDVDGTLIDIAIHPDAVTVPSGLLTTLGTLKTAADGALALVSGRTVAGLDALFSPLKLAAAGVHGGEIRLTPEAPVAQQSAALPPETGTRISRLARDLDGVLMEDKGSSIAVHYRLAPQIGPDLQIALEQIVTDYPGLSLLPGRLVFEVKRAGCDKGVAVRQFMAAPGFAGRTPVFIGDDVTDEAAFAAVSEMGGIAVSVGRNLPVADLVLPEAQDVRALLATLVAQQPEE